MDLTKQSITGHRFELNRRGYDPDTVDAHLAEIATAAEERNSRFAELESTVGALQAKVQDANESEEALRLTLKAAAHAKEELLANAREQAKGMEEEAAGKARAMVAEAESKAAELTNTAESHAAEVTSTAQARAQALEEGAKAQAGEVARAALAESEVLVARIEDLRGKLEATEAALGELRDGSFPQVEAARESLNVAIAKARETAESPEMLAAVAQMPVMEQQPVPPVEVPPVDSAEHGEPQAQEPAIEEEAMVESDHHPEEPPAPEMPVPEMPVAETPASEFADERSEPAPVAEESSDHAQERAEAAPESEEQSSEPADGPPGAPHLEVVESEEAADDSPESAAEISDKVDRLLEELREVT